jgi:hypothetical protein
MLNWLNVNRYAIHATRRKPPKETVGQLDTEPQVGMIEDVVVISASDGRKLEWKNTTQSIQGKRLRT